MNCDKIDNADAGVGLGHEPKRTNTNYMVRNRVRKKMKLRIHLKIDELIASDDETYEFPYTLTRRQLNYCLAYCRMKGLKRTFHGTGDNQRLIVYKNKTALELFVTTLPTERETTQKRVPKLTRKEMKLQIQLKIDELIAGDDEMYEFPSKLTKCQLKFSHEYCRTKGLKTNSHGGGDNERLTIYKTATAFESFHEMDHENNDPNIPNFEAIKIEIEQKIDEFIAGDDETYELPFPILTRMQRKYCNQYCRMKGLKTEWQGKGTDLRKIAYKTESKHFETNFDSFLTLSPKSIKSIHQLLTGFPLSVAEQQPIQLTPLSTKNQSRLSKISVGIFTNHQISVPPTNNCRTFDSFRSNLPIYPYRETILKTIDENQVVIVCGETGSGKTTQIPQYIMELCTERREKCRIICTQPRRIAAKSMAERISEERGVDVGITAGYQIRLESRITTSANLIFTTSGYMLRCLISSDEASLSSATHIILDEIHERDQFTDFLLISIRDTLRMDRNLRVILMSATIDTKIFSAYFNDCPILQLPGRMFEVEVRYLDDILLMTNCEAKKIMVGDQIDHSLLFNLIILIHKKMPDGSILVFLPGFLDICKQYNRLLRHRSNTMNVLRLHGQMRSFDQNKVFQRKRMGKRTIILSTNIAETSITIDGVVYVIDCGKAKLKMYKMRTESTALEGTWISKACAMQRCGRAGRTRPGQCYRMYSKIRYNAMDEFTVPEILRVPLTEICLNARILGGSESDILTYLSKAIQPPNEERVKKAIVLLKQIGALNEDETITDLGLHLVDLPVDVQLGKAIILSVALKCVDPVVTIVSVLSNKDPFILLPRGGKKLKLLVQIRKMARDYHSDLMVYLNIYNQWNNRYSMGTDQSFCLENNLNCGQMILIHRFRQQILGSMVRSGLIKLGETDMYDVTKNSSNWSLVKACFVGASYPNIARIYRDQDGQMKHGTTNIQPHPTSILPDPVSKQLKQKLIDLPSEWIIFGEKTSKGNKCFAACNTVVTPITIALFARPIYIPEMIAITPETGDSDDMDDEMKYQYLIDDVIGFTLPNPTATAVYDLRRKFSSMFIKLLNNQSPTFEQDSTNELIVQTISDILLEEEQQYKFRQPNNIGHRPIQAVNLHQENRQSVDSINSNEPSTSSSNQSNRFIVDEYWRDEYNSDRIPMDEIQHYLDYEKEWK